MEKQEKSENFRDRYEFVISFIAVIVSFGAFKEELQAFFIDIGFFNFNLSQYFLFVVIGFSASFYLYSIERVFSKTVVGNWKIFNYIIISAYSIFVLLLFSPVIIILSYLATLLVTSFNKIPSTLLENIITTLLIIISCGAGGASIIIAIKYFRNKRERTIEELEEQELEELDLASRLYHDGYFSQAILETFKTLELHLYKVLNQHNLRAQKQHFNRILRYAQEHNILQESDVQKISEIKKMRNGAIHVEKSFTKEQAENVLHFTKDFIKRTSK